MNVKRLFGRQPVTMPICLANEGEWLSPCHRNYVIMAYAIAAEVAIPEWYPKAVKGKPVSIVVPNRIADNKSRCGVCCKYGVADAKMLGSTSRDEGNDENTYYLLGMKAEKGFANVIGKDNSGVDRAYRKLVYDVFGINPDAKDFYDQLLRKHLEITGDEYNRDVDDGSGLYDNAKVGNSKPQQPSSGQANSQQSNPQPPQPTDSEPKDVERFIDRFKVDNQGGINVDGVFAFYPQDFSAVVAEIYGYCEEEFEDGKGATMEITELIGRACLNAIRRCLGVAENKRHSDRDCLRFLCQMLDLKNVDQALALLYPKSGRSSKQQNGQNQNGNNGNKRGSKPEGAGQQTGGNQQNNAGQKPAEPASQQPQPQPAANPADDGSAGFGDDPLKDMTEGKPVRFEIVEKVIGLAEQGSSDVNISMTDKGKLALAALILKQAISERKQEDPTASTIGAVYLNNLLREIEAYGLPLGGKCLMFNET